MDYVFRLPHHLAFGYPEGRLGYGDRKVVNFDTIELAYRDLDGVKALAAKGDRAPLEEF